MRVAVCSISIFVTLLLTANAGANSQAQPDYGFSEAMPQVLYRVPVRYPAQAIQNGIRGTVVARVLIDTLGHASRTEVERSVPGLDSAVVTAVRQWRFAPARFESKPIPVWVRIPIRFAADSKNVALVWDPICRAETGLKQSARSPRLCALRRGEDATFVLFHTPSEQPDSAFFEISAFPDSCDVELALGTTGFARGHWPCDQKTGRLRLPDTRTSRTWLVPNDFIVVRKAKAIPSLEGTVFHPGGLWLVLFSKYPTAFESVPADPATPSGTYDNEVMPEVRTRTEAHLSEDALNRRLTGRVIVRALVDRAGHVAVARVPDAGAAPELVVAALEAIRDWTFVPGRDGSEPRAMWVAIPFDFGNTSK